MREVGNEVFDDPHIRERVDSRGRIGFLNKSCASQSVRTVHIHGAGAAYSFAAGAAEGQRRVDIVLDPDQCIQNHGTAIVEIDFE